MDEVEQGEAASGQTAARKNEKKKEKDFGVTLGSDEILCDELVCDPERLATLWACVVFYVKSWSSAVPRLHVPFFHWPFDIDSASCTFGHFFSPGFMSATWSAPQPVGLMRGSPCHRPSPIPHRRYMSVPMKVHVCFLSSARLNIEQRFVAA